MPKTNGEWFAEALACTNREQAQAWLEADVARRAQEENVTPERARFITINNLGYMAGYYSADTAKKILELFGAPHPIFGRDYFGVEKHT